MVVVVVVEEEEEEQEQEQEQEEEEEEEEGRGASSYTASNPVWGRSGRGVERAYITQHQMRKDITDNLFYFQRMC